MQYLNIVIVHLLKRDYSLPFTYEGLNYPKNYFIYHLSMLLYT